MAKTKIDLDALRQALDHIEARPLANAATLHVELVESHHAKISNNPKGSTWFKCTIGGLSATGRNGKHQAIENWANAARRTLRVAA